MMMVITANIHIVFWFTMWQYEIGTITFHITAEETEVRQVRLHNC